MAVKTNTVVKVASLFTGCGGLDLGFLGNFRFMGRKYASHPVQIVFANDIDHDATECYNSNSLFEQNGSAKSIEGDIRKIDFNTIPNFDVLLGGFPCQPFSNAGNRKGVNDDNGRGTLFEMCEALLVLKMQKRKLADRPKAFVFENVRGILSSKMPDGETVPNEIVKRMEKLGFDVAYQLVCASDYGVPQMRYRVLIVGIRKDLKKSASLIFSGMDNVVKNKNIPSKKNDNYESLLLGSILQNLPSNGSEFWEYSKTTQDMVEDIGPCSHGDKALPLFKPNVKIKDLPKVVFEGRSWKNVPPEKLTPRFRKIYDDPKKYHAPKFFRRFAFGEINGTITASAQPENCGITHPTQNRRFTVRECARIQSFPDNFVYDAIPLQSRYKVIGNAVPPVLAWVVASSLIPLLMKK